MGYTYDWGYDAANPNDYVGATEFILKPGSYEFYRTRPEEKPKYKTVASFFK